MSNEDPTMKLSSVRDIKEELTHGPCSTTAVGVATGRRSTSAVCVDRWSLGAASGLARVHAPFAEPLRIRRPADSRCPSEWRRVKAWRLSRGRPHPRDRPDSNEA